MLDLANALNTSTAAAATATAAPGGMGVSVSLHREAGWQTSADAFLSRLEEKFNGYRDVTEPAAAAVHIGHHNFTFQHSNFHRH